VTAFALTEEQQAFFDRVRAIAADQLRPLGHLLEHLYREVRAPRIYEGASEVQRTIIARDLYR
jgi:acyl-CoA dehydrogenase